MPMGDQGELRDGIHGADVGIRRVGGVAADLVERPSFDVSLTGSDLEVPEDRPEIVGVRPGSNADDEAAIPFLEGRRRAARRESRYGSGHTRKPRRAQVRLLSASLTGGRP